jgi:mannose/fructose/N-acetylgalactosamine-specific phosphotransferase system component IID
MTSQQHLTALVLAGMIAMSVSLKIAIPLARRDPVKRMSLEKIFDYVIAGLVGLKKLTDLSKLRPDPGTYKARKDSVNH